MFVFQNLINFYLKYVPRQKENKKTFQLRLPEAKITFQVGQLSYSIGRTKSEPGQCVWTKTLDIKLKNKLRARMFWQEDGQSTNKFEAKRDKDEDI